MAEHKKKRLVINIDGDWILKHRDDEQLPIAAIKDELSKNEALTIADCTFTSLTIVYDEEADAGKDLEQRIYDFFNNRYPEDMPKDAITVETGVDEVKPVEEVAADKSEEKSSDKDESSDEGEKSVLPPGIHDIFRKMNGTSGEAQGGNAATKDKADAMSQINKLVGATEFKALAAEVNSVADDIRATKTFEVFANQCYLFSIGNGCGLTTYLKLFAQLISEKKLCSISSMVNEVYLKPQQENKEPLDEAYMALSTSASDKYKVLCFDISEWMNKTDAPRFKKLLRDIGKCSDEYIVVFRVPFVDKDVLERIRFSLSDLLCVRSVSIPPLRQDEIRSIAADELKRLGFSITAPSWKYFFERITEEKSDGRFYGINTVKKVVKELVYKKLLANVGKEEKNKQITAADAKALCTIVSDSNLSGAEQLDKLVGVEGIKQRVQEIVAQIRLSIKEDSKERPCIHMRFVGNPGTGKTTVARIIGKMLKEQGILRIGSFYEYAGRDFCGRYIGETAPKTSSICRDAYGSVLFIDEAYSLYRGDDDTRDYGREAIDTLIAEMENHRNDFVVIMAGYPDDMDTLMKGNSGLSSRMPYLIEFPNFTREQLYDIFVSMIKEKFKYDCSILVAAHDFFTGLPEEFVTSKEFSNARYVRNLFERTWAKAAMRCQLSGKPDVTLTREDFEQASADKEFTANIPKRTKLGF